MPTTDGIGVGTRVPRTARLEWIRSQLLMDSRAPRRPRVPHWWIILRHTQAPDLHWLRPVSCSSPQRTIARPHARERPSDRRRSAETDRRTGRDRPSGGGNGRSAEMGGRFANVRTARDRWKFCGGRTGGLGQTGRGEETFQGRRDRPTDGLTGGLGDRRTVLEGSGVKA